MWPLAVQDCTSRRPRRGCASTRAAATAAAAAAAAQPAEGAALAVLLLPPEGATASSGDALLAVQGLPCRCWLPTPACLSWRAGWRCHGAALLRRAVLAVASGLAGALLRHALPAVACGLAWRRRSGSFRWGAAWLLPQCGPWRRSAAGRRCGLSCRGGCLGHHGLFWGAGAARPCGWEGPAGKCKGGACGCSRHCSCACGCWAARPGVFSCQCSCVCFRWAHVRVMRVVPRHHLRCPLMVT